MIEYVSLSPHKAEVILESGKKATVTCRECDINSLRELMDPRGILSVKMILSWKGHSYYSS